MKNLKIIIAEDEYWIRKNICRLIAQIYGEKLEILEAGNGEDVLVYLQSESVDLVLTDLNMPFMDGLELIRNMQREYKDIPILVLSGYNEFELVRDALTGGALDYLLKPVDEAQIQSAMEKALKKIEERKQEREIRHRYQLQEQRYLENQRDLAFSSYLYGKKAGSDLRETLNKYLNDPKLPSVFLLVHFYGENMPKKLLAEQMGISAECIFRDTYHQGTFFILPGQDEDISKCCRRLKKYAASKNLTVRISRGESVNDISDLPKMYGRLRFKAVQNTRYKKGVQCIDFDTEDIRMDAAHRISLETESEIRQALTQKKKAVLQYELLEKLGLKNLEQDHWLLIEIQQLIGQLHTLFFSHYADDQNKIYEIDHLFDSIEEAILRMDTPEFLELMNQVIDLTAADGSSDAAPCESPDLLIDKIKMYIDLHYMDNLTLSMLAEQYYTTPSYLSRIFKKHTGENLIAYITGKRLEKAREMIQNGSISLTDVAFLVGYNDYTYFNKVFRRYEGISPAQYREQCGNTKK